MPVINPLDPTQNNPQWQADKPQGAIAQVPDSLNYQSPLGFRFHIRRLPNVNFYVKRVNVPGVTLPAANRSTPFIDMPEPGDHVQYEPLVLTFQVDNGMRNYFELQKWLLTIGDREGGPAYAKMAINPEYTGYGVKSEILVSVLNAQKNVVRNITYHDAWPTQISGLQYDVGLKSVEYLTAVAVFRYIDYDSSTDV